MRILEKSKVRGQFIFSMDE